MTTSVRTHLDFLKASEIRNALIHPVTENPVTPVTGQICYRSDTGYLQVYDGAAWNIFVDKEYVDGLLATADAMFYKGATDCSLNPNYPAANAGDVYKVSVAGKIGGASGVNVEVGDMFICTADSTASGDQATVGSSWNIIQSNIDGAVIGPASSTDNTITRFDGTTGKLIQSSSVTIDDSGSVNIPADQTYSINSTTVLSATALGSGVTSSSLTGLGTVTSGNVDAVVSAASTTAAGKVELATETEVKARTSSALAVTPAGLASFLNHYTATFTGVATQTITAATHGITTVTDVIVQEDDGTKYVGIIFDYTVAKADQEVIWTTTAGNFNGRVIIVGV